MFKNALYITGLAAIVAPAFAAAEWMTDLDAAKTKAAAENKAVLVDFTGSDWCGWCIKLKKEVFSTPEFEAYAADKFVLVEIDVPNDAAKVGGAEQLVKNQELCAQYGVEGFPTIMVMTPAGEIVGGFVGGADLKSAQAALDAALANVKSLEAASKLEGVEKAKALMAVYKSMPEDFAASSKALRDQIVALDPENATGIQDELKAEAELEAIKAKLGEVEEGDFDAMLAIVEEALKTAHPANVEELEQARNSLLQYKFTEMLTTAETVEDVQAVKQYLLDKMLPLVPEEEREAVKARIEEQFADPEAVLAEIKAAAAQGDNAGAAAAEPAMSEEDQAALSAIMEKLRACGEDMDAGMKVLDEALATAEGTVKETLSGWKMMLIMQKVQQMALSCKTVEDVMAIKEFMLNTVLPMMPEDQKEGVRKEIEDDFSDPAAMLEQFKQMQDQMAALETADVVEPAEPQEETPAETPAEAPAEAPVETPAAQ